jgi:ADP-ribose pyrophosphatase YjhB (NUDIX family)
MPIRNSAKAIIIRGGKILCTKNLSQFNEIYYLLPGGGQEHGETLIDALKRECFEELGLRVSPKSLRYVRDYIGDNHEFKHIHPGVHQVEYMFICEIDANAEARITSADQYQIGIEWLTLAQLADVRLYPQILKKLISATGDLCGDFYLGDVN